MANLYTDIADGDLATPALWNDRFNALRKGDVFNVKAYGAAGNGTTDDTVAIQAAVAAAVAAGGGTIFLPPGNYLTTGITLTGAGIRLAGPATAVNTAFGTKGAIITVSGANYGVIVGGTVNDGESGFTIEHITFLGNASAKGGLRLGAVLADPNNTISAITLDTLNFKGFTSSTAVHTVGTGEPAAPVGAAGLVVMRGVSVKCYDLVGTGNYYDVLESSAGRATTFSFYSPLFGDATKNSVRLCAPLSWSFYSPTIQSNQEDGFVLRPQAGQQARNVHIHDAHIENNGTVAGDAQVTYDAQAAGSQIYNCSIDGMDLAAPSRLVDGVEVAGNAFLEVRNLEYNTDATRNAVQSDDTAFVVVYGPPRDSTRTMATYALGAQSILLCPTDGNLGIDTKTPTSKLDVQGTAGGFIRTYTAGTHALGGETNLTVYADATSGDVNLTLPDTYYPGRRYVIQRIDGTGNHVYLVPAGGGQTLNGSISNADITTQWGWMEIVNVSGNWIGRS